MAQASLVSLPTSLLFPSFNTAHHGYGTSRTLIFVAASHTRPNGCTTTSSARSRCLTSLSGAAGVAAAALAAGSPPAHAVTAEEVALVLTKVQNVYLQITGVTRAACGTVGMLFDLIISLVKATIGATTPYIQNTTNVAMQVSAPIASGVIMQAENSLQSIGINTKPAAEAIKTVALIVKEAIKQISTAIEPVASSILQSLLATDSLFLVRAAGTVVVVSFLAPPIFTSVACATKGYKGKISALQAVDLVMKNDYLLIDVRTEKEKSKSGVPSLSRYVINKLIFVPVEELSVKFKGRLRDYRRAEAEVAAIKISYLKRINKSSKLVILDSYGDIAKLVARSLTRLGFKNTWVVMDGFDGGRGWVQSRLGTASHSANIAELLLPSRIISEGAKRIFPSSKDIDVSPQPRTLLPGGYND